LVTAAAQTGASEPVTPEQTIAILASGAGLTSGQGIINVALPFQ
jgi:hypothetical protein